MISDADQDSLRARAVQLVALFLEESDPTKWPSTDTKEGRDKLQKQVDDLKADMANKETTYKLELAGCKNAKAGKALLEDHGGDIAKLKEAEPWLFEGEKKTGSTGKKPVGTASDLDDKLDRAFGLKK